jgi:hypothetical protein
VASAPPSASRMFIIRDRDGVRRVGAYLCAGSDPLLPSVIGGEGRSWFVALAAVVCLALRTGRLWRYFRCHLLPLGRSVASRPPQGCRSRRTRAGRVQVFPAPPVVPGGRRTRRTPRGRRSCSGTVPFSFLRRGRERGPAGALWGGRGTPVRCCWAGGRCRRCWGGASPCTSGCLRRRGHQHHLHSRPLALWLYWLVLILRG